MIHVTFQRLQPPEIVTNEAGDVCKDVLGEHFRTAGGVQTVYIQLFGCSKPFPSCMVNGPFSGRLKRDSQRLQATKRMTSRQRH